MGKWKDQIEGQYLRGLFANHFSKKTPCADPTMLQGDYIEKQVREKHAMFKDHRKKNFNVNYRRCADSFLANRELSGGRRRK